MGNCAKNTPDPNNPTLNKTTHLDKSGQLYNFKRGLETSYKK